MYFYFKNYKWEIKFAAVNAFKERKGKEKDQKNIKRERKERKKLVTIFLMCILFRELKESNSFITVNNFISVDTDEEIE